MTRKGDKERTDDVKEWGAEMRMEDTNLGLIFFPPSSSKLLLSPLRPLSSFGSGFISGSGVLGLDGVWSSRSDARPELWDDFNCSSESKATLFKPRLPEKSRVSGEFGSGGPDVRGVRDGGILVGCRVVITAANSQRLPWKPCLHIQVLKRRHADTFRQEGGHLADGGGKD